MFRKLAHLKEQLGNERFAALISSDNTGKVKEFCDQIIGEVVLRPKLTVDGLPAEMKVGHRIYDILDFRKEGENIISSKVMAERAEKEVTSGLGEEDGEYLLKYQEDIPAILRGKVVFLFPYWHPDRPYQGYHEVNYVVWSEVFEKWVDRFEWEGSGWSEGRALRRKYGADC